MTCAACGHSNRAGRRFCAECGASLARVCAACNAPYEEGEKFCGECGGSLAQSTSKAPPAAPSAADAGARKVVTIVFADLVGSTALHERLDAESAQHVMERYYDALRAAVDAHAGTVVKLLGDGVMAAFGLRQVAEDDAIRAVRAGVAMQDAFRDLVGQQPALAGAGLRVAVNTGEVVVSGAMDDVIGDPVNVAARLQEQGRDGDVVVGEETRRLVAARVTLVPLGSVTLKGRTGAVAAYRLESLEAPAGATATAFVGRDDELARLVAVYDAAAAAPAARLAVLLGSPGLGKSRLIDELGRRLGDGTTLLGAHCDAAGGATFAPIAMAVRAHLGIDDAGGIEAARAGVEAALATVEAAERSRIAAGIAALLTGSPAAPEETFFVVRRLLAALAREKPVVLVIDDVHWAEPLLLDLVEHLIQWGAGVALFVLVAARPELRDVRSSLVTPGGLVSDVVTLGGLDAGAAMRLAASVIGASDLPAAVAGKVLATSEGNPLFVGELVRMLVQEGALAKEGERWTASAGLAQIEMPPTIHALLAARIERLRPDERAVLERAAVVGRHFSRSAVAALLGRNGSELDARLEALRRSELIERDTGWLLGEPALRFHHVLIRDAAYRRLLKGTRAELHERLADWIEAKVGDAAEHDETIGRHLEQAHQLLGELGPVDAHGKTLGERAAGRLAAAGRRALARDDVPLAAGLLGRAIERLDADDEARADLALDWCEALLSAGEVGPAAGAIAELDRFTEGSERLRGWHTCFATQLAVMTAPEQLHDAAERVASAARDLAKLEDAGGEAKAHFVHAQALARLGKVGACEAALDQALAAARRAGDRRRANAVLAGAPLAALWGPSPVTRASGRCLDVVRVLRITQGAPAVEAVALSCQGVLEALRGRTDAARRMLAASRTMVEELGITQRLYEADAFIGRVDLLEGGAAAAEQRLRPAYEGLRALGLGIDAARAAALLGRALLAQGRAEEAERLSNESELLAGDDLQAAIAWRGVRAEALAARGEHDAAVALATKAVEIAAATDALLDHADARVALAAALRAAGRHAEADAEGRRARELWDAKGATLLAERAERPVVVVAPSIARPSSFAERAARRRFVRHNFAMEEARLAEAVLATRDVGALDTLYRRDVEIVDHQYGRTYGYAEVHERLRIYIEESSDSVFVHEPLATLGDSLALVRLQGTTSASALYGTSTGATENRSVLVIEADEQGAARRIEIFNDDKLNDALVRLFERYAELLPEGADRVRTAGAARALADMLREQQQREWLASALAPDVVCIDHRLVSFGTLHGKAAVLEAVGAFLDLVEDMRWRVDDVVEVTERAVLALTTNSGSNRIGGGAFERAIRFFVAFDAEGRIVRWEIFELSDEAAALARFEELSGARPSTSPVARRVRPNLATVTGDRTSAAISRRDAATVGKLFNEAFEEIDHPTGSTYRRDGAIASIERLMRSDDVSYALEPLATLGPALMLGRRHIRASGARGHRFDVGEYENRAISLHEVDAEGRHLYHEVFTVDRLDDALVHLYQRYAERLSDVAERVRAAKFATSLDNFLSRRRTGAGRQLGADALAPDAEWLDHRQLSTWSARGASEIRKHIHALDEVAADVLIDLKDLLALEPHVLLVRRVHSGTDRRSGGRYEREFLLLIVSAADGQIARMEFFDTNRQADALTRFDQFAGAERGRRRVRDNAASRGCERFDATLAARDADALEQHFAESMRLVHHPTGATYARRGMLATWRSAFKAERFEFRRETLATLGETLVLSRQVTTVDGLAEEHLKAFGPTEVHELSVVEMDERGGMLLAELFAPDRLGDALVRLYEIHSEQLPGGPERARAEGIARSIAAANGEIDADRMARTHAPSSRIRDHRVLGTWSADGRDEIMRHWRLHLELAPDFTGRHDDVLASGPRLLLTRMTFFGTSETSGGVFENEMFCLFAYGSDGRIEEIEVFEADDEATALARFDEVTAEAPRSEQPHRTMRRVRPNAGTAAMARAEAAFARRDVAAVGDFSDAFVEISHPTGATYGREQVLDSIDHFLRLPGAKVHHELLATLGDRLWMSRASAAGRGRFDVGAFEKEEILVNELDLEGRHIAHELFAADRLRTATIRLYERYAESLPDGPERRRAAGVARSLTAPEGDVLDADAMASRNAPNFVCVDHRKFGAWSVANNEEWRTHWRLQNELAAGLGSRDDDILALDTTALARRQTFFGTSRASGGMFENVVLTVLVCDAAGLITRSEAFEPHQEAEALACFDRLVGAAVPERTRRRPVRPNRATKNFAGIEAAFDRRDLAALEDLLGDPLETVEHPTHTTYGRAGQIETCKFMLRFPDLKLRGELLATLGDSLGLFRRVVTASGTAGNRFDVGSYEHESIVVNEVDESGRVRRSEVFAADRLYDATVRLYERYAESLPPSVERERATVAARSVAAFEDPIDVDRLAACTSATFVLLDHRSLATWSSRGRDEWLRHWQEQVKLVAGFTRRDDDILAFTPTVNVTRCTYYGTGRESGGPFENVFLTVNVFDADGYIELSELFEPDQEAAALARFDELVAGAASDATPTELPFVNLAVRCARRQSVHWGARDWDGFAATLAPGFRFDDRRAMSRIVLDREQYVAFCRQFGDMPSTRLDSELLASRGECLSLTRVRLDVAGGDVGPSDLDYLYLHEADETGDRFVAAVTFDSADIDAAYAELHARWTATELAQNPRTMAYHLAFERAIANRDWEGLVALHVPTLVARDHRLVGWDVVEGPSAFVAVIRAMVDLAPDVQGRLDHIRMAERALIAELVWIGTRDGGAFESPFVWVVEVDADGKGAELDFYDPRHVDRAFVRFEEIRTATVPARTGERFANAASEGWSAVVKAIVAHDWERFERFFAPSFRCDVRRRVVQLELDRDQYTAFVREICDGRAVRGSWDLIATRGERLALVRLVFEFSGGDVGPSEIEFLLLAEVNERGLTLGCVTWDPEDLQAAYEELDCRWAAGEGSAGVARALRARQERLNRHDLAVFAEHRPDFVARDHRVLGWGDTLRDMSMLVRAQRALFDLAPDAHYRVDHLRVAARAYLQQAAQVGTREGGAFENVMLHVGAFDEAERARCLDVYDIDQMAQAFARFAELNASARQARTAKAPGATLASMALERNWAALDHAAATDDWAPLRAICEPSLKFADRQRFSQVSGDLDLTIESLRIRVKQGAKPRGSLLGTAGDRVAVARVLWSGGPASAPFEIEYFAVVEVAESGRIVAFTLFEDAGSAQCEATRRWAEIDRDAPAAVALVQGFVDAFDAHDRARCRAMTAADVIVEDHRHAGMGRLDGAEAYIGSLEALWKLAPDQRAKGGLVWHAYARYGGVTNLSRTGTLAEGGAFESEFLMLFTGTAGEFTRIEYFEIEHLDAALAQLEALRPDPLRIPPNAATRAWDRWEAAIAAGNLDTAKAGYSPTYQFEDRRRLVRTTVGLVGTLRTDSFFVEGGWRPKRTLLATAGDRLALHHVVWTTGEAGAESEIEALIVDEVSHSGRGTAMVVFDPDDRAAASAELLERYVASADGIPRETVTVMRAWNAHDLEALRTFIPADFYLDDRRRTGVGRLEGADAYLESLGAMWELSRDLRTEALYMIAVDSHGAMWMNRWHGTNAEGGAFEAVYVALSVLRDGRSVGLEIFEIDDLDTARARFDELGASR